MKKISMILILVALTATAFSQKAFDGFFKPVNKEMFSAPLGNRAITSTWLFRPVVQLTALQFNLVKPVEVSSLSSLGTGMSYTHFIEQNGEPYANFGVNALVLFTQDIGGVEPAGMGFALTISALQYINVGAGYSLGAKQFFILTGISYNFN